MEMDRKQTRMQHRYILDLEWRAVMQEFFYSDNPEFHFIYSWWVMLKQMHTAIQRSGTRLVFLVSVKSTCFKLCHQLGDTIHNILLVEELQCVSFTYNDLKHNTSGWVRTLKTLHVVIWVLKDKRFNWTFICVKILI